MKKILILICVALGSCTTKIVEEQKVAVCPTQDLGLTLANKNPYLFETNMNYGGFGADSRKFYGTIANDTLKLKIMRTLGTESSLITFYNIKIPTTGCPTALSTKQVWSTFNNTITHNTTFDTTFDEFRVQQYISANLLVCKTKSHYVRQDGLVVYDNRAMWIDLTTLTPN